MLWLIAGFSFILIFALWLAAAPALEYRFWKKRLKQQLKPKQTPLLLQFISGLPWGQKIEAFVPGEYRKRIHALLIKAGLEHVGVGQFIMARVVLFVVLGGLAALALPRAPMVWLLIACCGYYSLLLWLRDHASMRQQAFSLVFPQVIDVMALSMEAGSNFLGALGQVVNDLQKGVAKEELLRLHQELRLGQSPRAALTALAQRLQLPEVDSFALTIMQAEQMGTSVARVMQMLAEQMRLRRAERLEAAALLLPIKLLFPLVFLIFPALLVVLLAPLFLNNFFG